eukprot:scaffold120645_cov48-Phaeocystis_antarctica.AAC.1
MKTSRNSLRPSHASTGRGVFSERTFFVRTVTTQSRWYEYPLVRPCRSRLRPCRSPSGSYMAGLVEA